MKPNKNLKTYKADCLHAQWLVQKRVSVDAVNSKFKARCIRKMEIISSVVLPSLIFFSSFFGNALAKTED